MKNRMLLFIAAALAAFIVPAAESAPLIVNDDDTVSDYRTGLTWQKSEGGAHAWESALTYCNELSPAGTWRLPNVKELESITDDTKFNPALDTAYFTNAGSSYWSSTTYLEFTDQAWYVRGGPWNTYKTLAYGVRCVRTTPCTYSISPESLSFGVTGGTGSVSVNASFQGCDWQTVNNLDWVAITSGGDRPGNGIVDFSVSANGGTERSGSISIADSTFTINQSVSPYITFTPSFFPSASAGSSYSQTLSATGGVPPYTWAVTSGTLPPGLSFNSATGELSGVPTTTGRFTFSVGAADSGTLTGAAQYAITVSPRSCSAAAITRTPGTSYSTPSSAYSAALDGDTIKALAIDFTGNVEFNRAISVNLKGGYDCTYSINERRTRLKGTVTITDGTVIIDNIEIE